ncbi:MAG: glycine betaine/proline transport system substrate-binding protein [Methanolobus sp. T82-4]|nr:MAG: glycine betaine/proline transport system substrate-binding protein [Methanolobus sp. T82-4]
MANQDILYELWMEHNNPTKTSIHDIEVFAKQQKNKLNSSGKEITPSGFNYAILKFILEYCDINDWPISLQNEFDAAKSPKKGNYGIWKKHIHRELTVKSKFTPNTHSIENEETAVDEKRLNNIDIKRGYVVLPDNNVRFGVKIANTTESVIADVEVILNYPDSLFSLQNERIQKIGIVPPTAIRTAEFILKPLGCVHNEHVDATITYRDHTYEKHVLTMSPKEIHCVCPFLRAKSMSMNEYLELFKSGHSTETGINFEGISADQLHSLLMKMCNNRLYRVEERSVDNVRIIYLAGESAGEETHYLLTISIKYNTNHIQVMLQAVSDKNHGLQGFLNEIVSELKHVITTVNSAREIGIIKQGHVINIIDSIVQRTSFSLDEISTSIKVQDSVIQRSEFTSTQSKINDSTVQSNDTREDKQENKSVFEEEEDDLRQRIQKETERKKRIVEEAKERIDDEKEKKRILKSLQKRSKEEQPDLKKQDKTHQEQKYFHSNVADKENSLKGKKILTDFPKTYSKPTSHHRTSTNSPLKKQKLTLRKKCSQKTLSLVMIVPFLLVIVGSIVIVAGETTPLRILLRVGVVGLVMWRVSKL